MKINRLRYKLLRLRRTVLEKNLRNKYKFIGATHRYLYTYILFSYKMQPIRLIIVEAKFCGKLTRDKLIYMLYGFTLLYYFTFQCTRSRK